MTNLEPGQSFGHYTIVSQTATDERGTTYRAYDSAAASDVLLRVLPVALAQSAGFEARFQALGASLRKLAHPNILRVLESGIVAGMPYLAMPNVEAVPLAERLAAGQIAPGQVEHLVTQVAAALQYAHQNGVTHGALSPANVLVDGSGNALLTDFGLADLRSSSAETATSAQRADQAGPRTDVAALGGLLLTLLTGKSVLPDDATLRTALGQVAANLPEDRRAEVAGAYARVVGKIASTNDSDRFVSVSDFLLAWQEAGKAAAPPRPESFGVAESGLSRRATGDGTPSAGSGESPATKPSTAAAAQTATTQAPPVSPLSPRFTQPLMQTPTPPASAGIGPASASPAPLNPVSGALAGAAQELARAQANALAAQQAAKAAATSAGVQAQAELAKARALADAARASGTQSAVRDGVRAALEITQRMARATPDPTRRAALEQITADLRQVADQRAAGHLTDEAAHAAIADLVRQVRQIEAQGTTLNREAIKGAVVAAASHAPAVGQVVRQQAAAVARPVAKSARPFVVGGAGLILSVCVGLMIVCAVVVSALPAATPTPTRVVVTLTRTPPTPAPRPSPTRTAPLGPNVTPAPAATAAPLRTTVVFTDTFAAGACNLAEADDDRRTLKCDRNEYVMLVKPRESRWAYYDAPEYQDAVIEFDARAISSSPTMEYGIIWRVSSDGNNFYGFTLKPNGEAAVFLYQNSDFSYFVQGLAVTNFRTGGGANHLTVTTQGPDISFAVNGRPLALTLTDSALPSGTIGFIINTTEPNAQAAFSNLTVSEIQ
jgi:serine/threonine protein kinase